jgi:hypothetical protein
LVSPRVLVFGVCGSASANAPAHAGTSAEREGSPRRFHATPTASSAMTSDGNAPATSCPDAASAERSTSATKPLS